MVLKEPLKKKTLADNPWVKSPLRQFGVQSAIDVASLDELIAELRRK